MKPTHLSLASFGGIHYIDALEKIMPGISTRVIGDLDLSNIQLCPQSRGVLGEMDAAFLREKYPDIQFRLHANIKTMAHRVIYDAIDFGKPEFDSRWHSIKSISAILNAPCYTLHAGARENGDFSALIDRVRRLQDFMQIPVGVEGHYPMKERTHHLDSWLDYERLLRTEIGYVVDLSHLNIVARHEKHIDFDLVRALITSPRCLEIHLSGNNGIRDEHGLLKGNEWWLPVIAGENISGKIFFEGRMQ